MSPYKDGDSACTVNSVQEIIMNGGCDGIVGNRCGEYDNATTYTSDGETFAELPPMPIGLTSHCVVTLDYDNLFVTGGSVPEDSGLEHDNDKSFIYHSDTMVWEELPGLLTARVYHMCGTVHNSNGDQEVIVAGGYSYENSSNADLVDIYNIQNGQWRIGQSMIVI